jgi:predicted DNA-binding transcriptional regulator AlpA
VQLLSQPLLDHNFGLLRNMLLSAANDRTMPDGARDRMKAADHAAFAAFDTLPSSANVRMPVVAALFCISPATVWRWCHAGHLPKPLRIGGVAVWNVGLLREAIEIYAKSDATWRSKVTEPVHPGAEPGADEQASNQKTHSRQRKS